MRKLENTKADKNYLQTLILSGLPVKAIILMGVFTDMEDAESLETQDYTGTVTHIDLDSGYCDWTNKNGGLMPCVNINCITLP